MRERWTEDSIPDLSGKTAIVTGANSGVGFEISKVLARHGARVFMACRNLGKANDAVEEIRVENPAGDLRIRHLDLASLASVTRFSAEFLNRESQLHLLINNAGLMAINEKRTVDGFEMQFAVNYLGHFALSSMLMPLLTSTPGSRLVSVSSNAHKFGKMDFDDLMYERRRYSRWGAYGQSKLAILLFILELNNRPGRDSATKALAAHPGVAHTKLGQNGGGMVALGFHLSAPLIAHSAYKGSLPVLRAATDSLAQGGQYFGPRHSLWGSPVLATPSNSARNSEDARRLWAISEELTGTEFPT
ncbi:MAG TPA: oxidoreductase [Candidatus Nanopelagicaceae bacterium]